MHTELLTRILEYFTLYGYWVVFFGVMLENAGLPIPGETILLAAGFRAYQGHFHIPTVMVVAAVGAMIGDNAGYLVGRKLGRAALERYGLKVGLKPHLLARFDRFFERNGNRTIFFARFITGLRVFAALLAGAANMPWKEFLFYNSAGAVVWAVVITLVGYFFGKSLDLIISVVGGTGTVALVVIVLVMGFLMWRKRRNKREEKDTAGAEEATKE
jgi:membrane protein DedA with SNARE-associated domain